MKKKLTLREGLREVLLNEMEKDKEMILMGENHHFTGSTFSMVLTPEFHKRFGKHRVLDTPVSENAIAGAALGASLAGMTVVAEIYSADFLFAVGNELINDISKWRYQHRYPYPIKLVIRSPMGVQPIGGGGAEHSQCPEAVFNNSPGLTIVAPSSVRDGVGLLRSCIRSGNPVLFLEHRQVYDISDEMDLDEDFTVPIGKSSIAYEGNDITIVAWSLMKLRAVNAAEILRNKGISVEIVDPRTIKPMDMKPISESVEKTGRLLVVEEIPRTGSVGAEIIASIAELKSDMKFARLTMPDIPIPCNPTLEAHAIPSVNDIVLKVEKLVRDNN